MRIPIHSLILAAALPARADRQTSIENGSAFATSYTVEIQLEATDNYALGQAMVSTQPQFPGATWQPWNASLRFTLPESEGPVNLYAKVRDAAGNVSTVLAGFVEQESPSQRDQISRTETTGINIFPLAPEATRALF